MILKTWLSLLLFISSIAFADIGSSSTRDVGSTLKHGAIIVSEVDGDPRVHSVQEVKVSSGDLTDNGDGTVSINTVGSSAPTTYLRLDAANDPLTGALEIDATTPSLTLTNGNDEQTIFTRTGSSSGFDITTELTMPATGISSALQYTATSSDKVTLASSITGVSNSYSVCMWVFTPSATTASKRIVTATDESWYIAVGKEGARDRKPQYYDGSTLWKATANLGGSTWYFLCFVKTTTTARFYGQGGVLLDTNGGMNLDTIDADVIGNQPSGTANSWDGKIEGLTFWDKALSVGEMQEIYNSGDALYQQITTSPYDDAAFIDGFRFDENTGSTTTSWNTSVVGTITNPDWQSGKEPDADTTQTATVIHCEDGTQAGEKGICAFGEEDGRTVIEGNETRFNINGVEVGEIDNSGDLRWDNNIQLDDNGKLLFGSADDASIYYDSSNIIYEAQETGAATHIFTFETVNHFLIHESLGLVFGSGIAGRDLVFTFHGEDNSGTITWKEDEDRFQIPYDISLFDNDRLLFGTGQDASIYYNGAHLNIDSSEAGTGDTHFIGGDVKIVSDAYRLYFGAAADSSQYFDGSDMIHTTTGDFRFTGDKQASYNVISVWDSSASAVGVGGGIAFVGNYGPGVVTFGAIDGVKANATGGNYDSNLRFWTRSNGGSLTEALRIQQDQDLLLPADNRELKFGTGADAYITYDGSNMILNPDQVGSGRVYIDGELWMPDLESIYLGDNIDAYMQFTGSKVELRANAVTSTDDLELIASSIKTDSGMIRKTSRYTTTQTLDENDHIVFCDTDGGAWTLSLPAGVEGTEYKIINVGANTLTVDPNGTEQLYGSGAGVASTLAQGEIINIHYNVTEGWW